MKNGPQGAVVIALLAERVGFEPTVRLHVRLISSQVHSTTLPPLRGHYYQRVTSRFGRSAECAGGGFLAQLPQRNCHLLDLTVCVPLGASLVTMAEDVPHYVQ